MCSKNKANLYLLPAELILKVIEQCPINCLPILGQVDWTFCICVEEVSRKLIIRYLDGDPLLIDNYKEFGDNYFRVKAMRAYLDTKYNTNMRYQQIGENCKENADLLHRVAKAGFQEVASILVARGMRARNSTCLFQTESDAEMTILLEAGADSKASTTKNYMNSLHFASQQGYVQAVNTLLKRGCLIEQRAVYQYTALHYAAKQGHTQVVQLLVNKGANIEALDSTQRTPLHLACLYTQIDVILFFIKHNANIEAIDCHGQTVLHYACLCRGLEHVYACSYRHLELVKILLAQGVNIEERNLELVTPLIYASKAGSFEIALYLLEHGAKANAVDKFGCTALHHASKEGHKKIVKLLLSQGANYLLEDIYDNLALHYACQAGHKGVVAILLHCKININVESIYGRTALHTAIAHKQPEIV